MQYSSTITPMEIDQLGLATFDGEIVLIDDDGKAFEDAINMLNSSEIIGFDTETKPNFQANTPRNNVALLQLSTDKIAYLFRLNEIGLPESLADILANPNIIKVGAAVHDDIRGLKRHRDFEASNFVDLQKIVSNYGISDKSVRKIAAIVLGIKVSKSQQLSNWEDGYLSDGQLNYAAIDAWVCREIYLTLKEEDE